MAAAFITCTRPRSMAAEHAAAWLERQADSLRQANSFEEVTLRELRPRGRHPLWLLHAVVAFDEHSDWQRLLGDLMGALRQRGMDPTVCIDERPGEARPDLLRAA